MPIPTAVTLPDIDRLCAELVAAALGPALKDALEFHHWFRVTYSYVEHQDGHYDGNEHKWEKIRL